MTTPMSYLQQYGAISEPKDRDRWFRANWREFFKELRESSPILATPNVTFVTRYRDVVEVLSRPEIFSVRLYSKKMDPVVDGPFMLARDKSPTNWTEKSVMRAMLVPGDLPRVRAMAGKLADESLDMYDGPGRIEVVHSLGRFVPLRICGDYFGFPGPDLPTMYRWSRATQHDMFKNLGDGDPDVHKASVQSGKEMREYLCGLLDAARKGEPAAAGDANIFRRLIETKFAPDVPFDDERIIVNMAGLLIGTGETTSQAIVQVIEQILQRPKILRAAQKAAKAGDDSTFDAIVWEALRFNPINPLLFRFCERPTRIAAGTDHEAEIPAGKLVFACTASAMFDEAAFPKPEDFDPTRPRDSYLHFGYGHHLCLGNLVAGVIVPEVVKRVLLRPNVRVAAGDEGKIDFQGGPFPESFVVEFG
jgi:cytochrome P450